MFVIIVFFFLKNINYINNVTLFMILFLINHKGLFKRLSIMIRNFFIGMSFLGILLLAFYALYDKKKESVFSLNTCQPLTCDLNLQDCVFSFNKKILKFQSTQNL